MVRRSVLATCAAILVALALVAPASAAFLKQASMTVVKDARTPTWKLTYLLCHTAPGAVAAEVSEYTYRHGAKSRTLQVWSWGKRTLPHPSVRGAGGSCSWYQSETYRSRFAQRAGFVNGVTLEIFDPSGQTITRTFRLHP